MQRLCTGALVCLFFAGCPVPEVSVPDFTPVTTADGGTVDGPAKTDGGGGGDLLGVMGWKTDKGPQTLSLLRGVWVADAALSQVLAVGQDGFVASRSAGGTWTTETSPTKENLYAVLGLPGGDAFAVGGKMAGVILHRQNGTWKQEGMSLKVAPLYGLAAVGGDVFAVGDAGTVAHLSGGTWQTETAPLTADLRAAYGKTIADVYAVGSGGAILHRSVMNGKGQWDKDTATVAAADMGDFYAITAQKDTIFVAGGLARVLRRDAMTMKWVPEFKMDFIKADMLGPPADLYGLYADDNQVLAVGSYGTVVRRDSMMMWTKENSGTSNDLYGISGAGGSVLAVGDQGAVLRRY